MGSLDEFLTVSRAAGTYDSESEFTVNLRQAFESLKKFTLAETGGYVRFLVASAIVRGATIIEIHTGPRRLQILENGAPLDVDAAETVFPSLLSTPSEANAAQRYLAAGLWGARNWGFSEARVDFPKASLVLRMNSIEVAAGGKPEAPGWNTITVVEKRSVGTLLGALVADRGWEHLKAGLRCLRYAKARITLNGTELREEHPCERHSHWTLSQKSTALTFDGTLVQSLRGKAPLSVVMHGICYETEDSGRLGGLVYCDGLRLDASYQGLVQNKTLAALMHSLRSGLYEAVFSQLAHPDFAPEGSKLALEFLRYGAREAVTEDLMERAQLAGPRGPEALKSLAEMHRVGGGLVVGPALSTRYGDLLDALFHNVIACPEELTPECLSLLLTPAAAVHAFDDGSYCLRYRHLPGCSYETHFFEDASNLMANLLGPDGFQLVNLSSRSKVSQAGAYLEDKIFAMGSSLAAAVDEGKVDPVRVSVFFARVLHWLRDTDRLDPRFFRWRPYLRFQREGGKYDTLETLRNEPGSIYRMVDEPEAPGSRALVLSALELELLEWEGVRLLPLIGDGYLAGARVIPLSGWAD